MMLVVMMLVPTTMYSET